MKKFMTKAEVLASFLEHWSKFIEMYPYYVGDVIFKREEWHTYVDVLEKDGLVNINRSQNWSVPF